MEHNRFFELAGALLGGYLAWMAGWDWAVNVLVLLMVLDGLAGVLAAGRRYLLDPATHYEGVKRKAMALLLVVAAAYLQAQVPGVPPLVTLVAGALASHELLSVIGHAAALGIDVPLLREVAGRLAPDSAGITGLSAPPAANTQSPDHG